MPEGAGGMRIVVQPRGGCGTRTLAVFARGVKGLLVVTIDLLFRADGGCCGAISGLTSLCRDSVSAEPSDSRRRAERVGLLSPFPRSGPDSDRVLCRPPPARCCCRSCCCRRCCCCCLACCASPCPAPRLPGLGDDIAIAAARLGGGVDGNFSSSSKTAPVSSGAVVWPAVLGLGLARGNRLYRALGCLPPPLAGAGASPAVGAFPLLCSANIPRIFRLNFSRLK